MLLVLREVGIDKMKIIFGEGRMRKKVKKKGKGSKVDEGGNVENEEKKKLERKVMEEKEDVWRGILK